MSLVRIISVALLAVGTQAWAQKGSSGSSSNSADFMKAFVRYGFGYGKSTISNVEPAAVQEFDQPRSFWQETDLLFPVSIHFQIRETWDDAANVDFYGAGPSAGEIYFTAINLGAKFTLPFFRVQPWVGGGVTGGFIAVSDPTNRNTHNWMVAFDKITKAVRGAYWQAGFDIVIASGTGLRLGIQEEKIRTDRYSNLNNTALEFNHKMIMIGAWGRAF